MLLTKSTTFIIGPLASILGYIMNAIFWLQEKIGIANIGLCIILFTIVIYLILTPLTIKQQKFSRLSSKMNPELQAIQKKYKGKNQDQAAMMKMNEETQAVYAKYGVNPMGSCVQLLIQMPILFALYRVIWNIPAYVTSVKEAFLPLAQKLLNMSGAEKFMAEAAKSTGVAFKEMTENTLIDVLYKFKPDNWTALADKFPDISEIVMDTQEKVDHMNYFLGLNIADAPVQIFMKAISTGAILLAIGAALIPILSAVSQWLNTKLMTVTSNTQQPQKGQPNTMDSTMKTMNTMMPIMSAVFCLTLPVGMGIYWIASAVFRTIIYLFIDKFFNNKSVDDISMDLDELVKKNLEKINAKRAKQGLPPQKITNTAKINTKHIEHKESSVEEKQEKMKNSTDYYKSTSTAKPGSLAAKAQMVKQYNEKNAKK